MRKLGTLILGVVLASGAALAFPWDIDMVDSPAFKAYEWKMRPLPEGSVARKGATDITNVTRMNADMSTPEGKAVANPYAADEANLARGKHLFEVYCQTCHGVGGAGGAPVGDNNPAAGKRRFLIPIPNLVGETGRAPIRTDGEIYLTVRNGKGAMPGYSWAMTEEEMWATVAYLRTLPGGAQNPPKTE